MKRGTRAAVHCECKKGRRIMTPPIMKTRRTKVTEKGLM